MILKQQLTKCLRPIISLYNHNITTISNITISQNKVLQILTNQAVCLQQMSTIIQNQCNFINGIRNVNAGIGFTQKIYQYQQKQKEKYEQNNIKKKLYKGDINSQIKTNQDYRLNIIPQIPQIFRLTQTLLNSIYRWIQTNSINTTNNNTNINININNGINCNNKNHTNSHINQYNNNNQNYSINNQYNNLSLPPAKCSNCHSIMQTIRVKQIKQQLMAIPGISTRLYVNSLKVNNSQQQENDNNFLNKQFWNSISNSDYQRQKHTLYAKADPYLTHWLAQQKLKQNKYYQVKAQIEENLDNLGKVDDLMIDQLIETMLGMFKKQLGRKQIMWRLKKFASKLKQLQIHREIQQQSDEKQKQKLRLKLLQKQKQQQKSDQCKCKCHHKQNTKQKQKDQIKPMTRFSVNTAAKLLVNSIIKVQTPAQRQYLAKLQQNNTFNTDNMLPTLMEHNKYTVDSYINQQSSQSDHSSQNIDKVQQNLNKKKTRRQHSKSQIGQSLKKLHKNANNSNKKFTKRASVVKNLPIHILTAGNKTNKKQNTNQNVQKEKDNKSIKQFIQTCQFGVQCEIKIQQDVLIKKTKNKIQRISKISNNFSVSQSNTNKQQKITGWEKNKPIEESKKQITSQTITNSQNSNNNININIQLSQTQNNNSQNPTKLILKSDNNQKSAQTESVQESSNKSKHLKTSIKLTRKSQHSFQSLTNLNNVQNDNKENKNSMKYKSTRISIIQKSKSSTSFHTSIVPLPSLQNNRDSKVNQNQNGTINVPSNKYNQLLMQNSKNEQLQKISISKYKKIRKNNNQFKMSNQNNNQCQDEQYRDRVVKTQLNENLYSKRQSLSNFYELDNKIQQILQNRKKYMKVKTQNNETNKKQEISISGLTKTSNKSISQKIFAAQDLQLFGGLSESSKFNAYNHSINKQTFNQDTMQNIQIGVQKIIKHINYLKQFKTNLYQSIISFLCHPYESIQSGNLIKTNTNQEQLRKILKIILLIHEKKCKQIICCHMQKFIEKIMYMGDNIKCQENRNFDKIKKKVRISK